MISRIYSFIFGVNIYYVVLLILLMVIGMFLEVLGIAMVMPAVYLILEANIKETTYSYLIPEYFLSLNHTSLIVIAMSLLGIVFFIKSVYIGLLTWMQTSFAFKTGAKLSEELYEKYLNQNFSDYSKKNSPEILRNLTVEIDMVVGSILQTLQVTTELIVILGIIIILISIEPLGSLITLLIFIIAGSIFYFFTSRIIIRSGIERQNNETLRNKSIQEGFNGFREIKLFGKSQFFINKYRFSNSTIARIGSYIQTLNTIPRLYIETLMVIALVTFVLLSIRYGYTSKEIISSIAILAVAGFRLLPSMNRIYVGIQHLRFSSPSISLIYNEINNIKTQELETGKNKSQFIEKISLRNLSFSYKNKLIIGPNLNFDINSGTFIGVCGPSGSGKSTLVNLISGLIEPDEGKICVDGFDIKDDLPAWFSQIGYVSQNNYLINDTIKRNIAFGIKDNQINENALTNAIKSSEIEEFIQQLDQGVDTLVGENGINISGGQKQRITIARILYNCPKIIIFDEATNALDRQTESEILDTIHRIESATVLIISHNRELLSKCDKTYILENGKLHLQ